MSVLTINSEMLDSQRRPGAHIQSPYQACHTDNESPRNCLPCSHMLRRLQHQATLPGHPQYSV